MADRTGTASDKQGLSLHRSGDEDGAVRGHRRHPKCCALRERHMIGQFGDQVDGECDVFRRGSHPAAVALPVVKPYPLAEPVSVHSRPDLIDDSGAVAVGDHPWVFHGGRAAPPIGV
jgi:hypothetical protein